MSLGGGVHDRIFAFLEEKGVQLPETVTIHGWSETVTFDAEQGVVKYVHEIRTRSEDDPSVANEPVTEGDST